MRRGRTDLASFFLKARRYPVDRYRPELLNQFVAVLSDSRSLHPHIACVLYGHPHGGIFSDKASVAVRKILLPSLWLSMEPPPEVIPSAKWWECSSRAMIA